MLAGYRAPSARTGGFLELNQKTEKHRTGRPGASATTNRNSKNDHSGQGYECEESHAQVSIFYLCSVDFRLRSLGGSGHGADRQRRNYRNRKGFLGGSLTEHGDLVVA